MVADDFQTKEHRSLFDFMLQMRVPAVDHLIVLSLFIHSISIELSRKLFLYVMKSMLMLGFIFSG